MLRLPGHWGWPKAPLSRRSLRLAASLFATPLDGKPLLRKHFQHRFSPSGREERRPADVFASRPRVIPNERETGGLEAWTGRDFGYRNATMAGMLLFPFQIQNDRRGAMMTSRVRQIARQKHFLAGFLVFVLCGTQNDSGLAQGFSTLGPSSPPSLGPTAPPNLGPTVAPNLGPTAAPRLGPTVAPRLGPTVAPSLGPTVAPNFGWTVPRLSVPSHSHGPSYTPGSSYYRPPTLNQTYAHQPQTERTSPATQARSGRVPGPWRLRRWGWRW